MSREAQQVLSNRFQEAEQRRKRLQVTFLASTGLSILMLLLVIALISRNIVRPIRAIARVMEAINSGDGQARFHRIYN